VGWIAHLVPFHVSASITLLEPEMESPTAVQTVADVHDTPFSSLLVTPTGLGVGWIAHLVPVQDAANVPSGPVPTAVHVVVDGHDTAFRVLPVVTAGLGVDWMAHFVPFHASARVTTVLTSLV
jgi:hypothetical protein